VQLNDRPGIVSKAVADLRDRSIAACEERLAPLGAEMASQLQATETGLIPMLVVRLGEKWRGSGDDLRQIAELKELRHFRLEGPPVTDEVVKMFAAKEKLAYLQLFDTKVTPAAVDAVKDKHPDAIVYVRNKAMLGVAAESHQDGVRVVAVVQGTGAATAGIVVHDIIATIDGHPLPDFDRLTARIAQHHPGDKIEVEIIRNSERMKFTPVLGARPEGE
jgi:membrane-associated protease RseP (regulator of RpoE activity)